MAAILGTGGTLLVAIRLYLRDYDTGPALVAGGTLLLGLAGLVAILPRWVKRPRNGLCLLAILLACTLIPPLSAFWPGGITAARFGLTVVGLCPLPVLDVTIRGDGVVGFRSKSHRITKEEILALAEQGVERVIVGTGWDEVAQVDPEALKLSGVTVEVLSTPAAFELYNRLRREGRRVALLAHSTC